MRQPEGKQWNGSTDVNENVKRVKTVLKWEKPFRFEINDWRWISSKRLNDILIDTFIKRILLPANPLSLSSVQSAELDKCLHLMCALHCNYNI